jgi:protein arginine N-methyltransferase 2
MMKWEWPLMKRHAQLMCGITDQDDYNIETVPIRREELLASVSRSEGPITDEEPVEFSVLNVGFGLGIIDSYIHRHLMQKLQKLPPGSKCHHYIIEAHPGVLNKMKECGWVDTDTEDVYQPQLTVCKDHWNKVMPELTVQFDAIFFDTFGEDYQQLREFMEFVPNLLRDEHSHFSFFNGLAGTQKVYHEVACRVAECDLVEMGLEVQWEEIPLSLTDEDWHGLERRYFTLDTYRLPICRFQTY